MELTLSNNLGQITEEIQFYKHQASMSLFEIGKRLKHVKENDLVHGQWNDWVECTLSIKRQTANRMIQAYEQFGTTSYQLESAKIFEMLSLPESIDRQEFIDQSHVIPSTGVEKTVDEMTVKELREVKKQLKEQQQIVESLKSDAAHWQKVAKEAQSTPPRVITNTVEVVPSDYNELKKQAQIAQKLNTENVQLKRTAESLRQTYEEKITQQQQLDASKKDLQKYLSEQLRSITMNHDSAIFNYTAIQGDREAYDIVMRFLHQYENIIKQQFQEWEQLTSIRAVN